MNIRSVALGSDHRGVQLKEALAGALKAKGVRVLDAGTAAENACDYPDFAVAVGEAVSEGCAERGVVICQSGIGMSIAANKVKGVRAALCRTTADAEFSRRHNDANVLALGAGFTKPDDALRILERWLAAEFDGGRHERRVRKIEAYEQHQPSR